MADPALGGRLLTPGLVRGPSSVPAWGTLREGTDDLRHAWGQGVTRLINSSGHEQLLFLCLELVPSGGLLVWLTSRMKLQTPVVGVTVLKDGVSGVRSFRRSDVSGASSFW